VEAANMTRDEINKKLGEISVQELDVKKTNVGCFHLKHLFSLKDQQVVLDSIRTLCIEQPQRVSILSVLKFHSSSSKDVRTLEKMSPEMEISMISLRGAM
jgi:hypothetical protein